MFYLLPNLSKNIFYVLIFNDILIFMLPMRTYVKYNNLNIFELYILEMGLAGKRMLSKFKKTDSIEKHDIIFWYLHTT